MSDNKEPGDNHSPARLFFILGAAIFAAEALVMLGLHLWLPVVVWVEMLLDSTLLVLLLFPVLYFFMFRPLTREIAERGGAQPASVLPAVELRGDQNGRVAVGETES